jgi:hypothetical protein
VGTSITQNRPKWEDDVRGCQVWVDAPTGRQHFCGLVIRTHLEAIITSRRFQSAPLPQNPPPTPADLKGCAALRCAARAFTCGRCPSSAARCGIG